MTKYDENMIAYTAAEAKLKESISTSRTAGQEKTKNLNLENNRATLWKLSRALNSEPNSFSPPSLETETEHLKCPEETTNTFIVQLCKVGNIDVDKFAAQKVTREINTLAGKQQEPEDNVMTDQLKKEELEHALKDLKTKKSPGP